MHGTPSGSTVPAAVRAVSLCTAGTAVPNRDNRTFPRISFGSQLAGLGWAHRDESAMRVVINPGGPMKRFTLRSALATGVAAVAIAGAGSVAAVAATGTGTSSGTHAQLTAATPTANASTAPSPTGGTPAHSGTHHCP